MFHSRNVDDQTYNEIIEAALARLPWLCADWTDYNAHDPGVTILELMAWYKEMQQYHMNVTSTTDAIRKKLLKLLGVKCRPESPARCLVEFPYDEKKRVYPVGTRLLTDQNIVFELEEKAISGAWIKAIHILAKGRCIDVSAMSERMVVAPFSFGGETDTQLLITFGCLSADTVRIWFDVDPQTTVIRNPFGSSDYVPRIIKWSWDGAGDVLPIFDSTHGLSISGYVDIPTCSSDRLILTLIDAGCEETVRLTRLSTGRFKAKQSETWSRFLSFNIEPGDIVRLSYDGASISTPYVFIREPDGWRQITDYLSEPEGDDLLIDIGKNEVLIDSIENLWIVLPHPIHTQDLLFNSNGLPGQAIQLELSGQPLLTDSLILICDTLQRDGQIRPSIWRCVDDLMACGPRDHVFTYDRDSEKLCFGDGLNGAIVPAQKAAILIASLEISLCGGGNLPPDNLFTISADGIKCSHTAALGGSFAQSVDEAAREFLDGFYSPKVCVTAADYERAALETPGLRVAAARAIFGFDPDEPTGRTTKPSITVVVVPFSPEPLPQPNEGFLKAVRNHLDSMRSIGISLFVIKPKYVGIAVAVTMSGDKQAVYDYFTRLFHLKIGGTLSRGDVQGGLMDLVAVSELISFSFRPVDHDARLTQSGDIVIAPFAIPYLKSIEITIK